MIDNFEIIDSFLDRQLLADEDKFYMIEILKLKKENPDIKKDLVLKRYYLKTPDQLAEWRNDIINLCKVFNARAVFHPNIKSEKRLAIEAMKELTKRFENDNFASVHHIIDSCAASLGSASTKWWVLDVDNEPDNPQITDLLINLSHFIPISIDYCWVIPTPNGNHILAQPFDARIFTEMYPNIQIKKNNSTILYAI